jgi:hypothetical protein
LADDDISLSSSLGGAARWVVTIRAMDKLHHGDRIASDEQKIL